MTIDKKVNGVVCSGCDDTVKHIKYWKNNKPYCNRCYQEIVSVYDFKKNKINYKKL